MAGKWVFDFETGDAGDKAALGGKGAALSSMTQAKLPVPPGFTITTDACRSYQDQSVFPDLMWGEVEEAIKRLEHSTGKEFGSDTNPLLVSVRSGAAVSMPGMMDTVLNLGINDSARVGLAKVTGDEQFAWDSYRRFVTMFGEIVLGVAPERFDGAVNATLENNDCDAPGNLPAEALAGLVERLKAIVYGQSRHEVPDDPYEQLRLTVGAVFDSWSNKRAQDYRNLNGIPHDMGTAVNIQAMVFGNSGENSGTGVAFTRNPTSGEAALYGEFLPDAQGEDVVAGMRTPLPIAHMAERFPDAYEQLVEIANRLETHYGDMQDLEFTVENGKLWMLQTRSGNRTGRAAVKIAVDMAATGLINEQEAVLRVSADQLEQLLHPLIDPAAEVEVIGTGLPASPGAVSGQIVLTADAAVDLAEAGTPVILVRHETNPDDFHGMVASRGTLTARGGVTSHAAVVARGMGKSCVVGCTSMRVDFEKRLVRFDHVVLSEGDWITVDGNTGRVLAGQVATIEPETDADFDLLMGWADSHRTLGVRANADTPEDAAEARRLGAQGIGLCRTEHMFFGEERIAAMREMIMASNEVARREALGKLEPYQTADFEGIFTAMDGFPVTIRLLDPPLHEFLPNETELARELTDLKLRLRRVTGLDKIDRLLEEIHDREVVIAQVQRLAEENPMLGHRGCRLALTYPEVTEMQARALFTAAVRCADRGISVLPEVMVPLVGFEPELRNQADLIRSIAEEVFVYHGRRVDYLVGTMVELPRACLMADELATVAEFFSFGTNDLTQMTLGMSRDDSSRFLPGYVQRGVIPSDPFQTLDVSGVGQLIRLGVERGRSSRPGMKIGVCGEHGGDAASIAFCHEVGLDYVSCSTYRVPVARLAAAHAALA
ncbi:MAG: pyruvate, phosphate dikinase [Acidimicrobiia bacterium]|nr:pyruvate, phosphate dikinase [Acidimicrobiia bacterium]MDH5504047.1 pyruvate, phosphate dikinase [Acidimicrobiia bacterium]